MTGCNKEKKKKKKANWSFIVDGLRSTGLEWLEIGDILESWRDARDGQRTDDLRLKGIMSMSRKPRPYS
jgi:hypothetical protein